MKPSLYQDNVWENLDWNKSNGLLPAIIQDANTGKVLMLAYMNCEALVKTLQTKLVTFYSRSKKRLWTKGEISGHTLELIDLQIDCDNDTLLVSVKPNGPTCHIGSTTCFGEVEQTDWDFIQSLQKKISERDCFRPKDSYVTNLFNAGIDRIAQKIGEEGVEVALAAVAKSDADLCSELADLLFHVLVLLQAKKISISNVVQVLRNRK